MNPTLLLAILVPLSAALSAIAVHFLFHKSVLQGMEQRGVHLKCQHCSCIVARYEQLPDGTIRCVNCRNAAARVKI